MVSYAYDTSGRVQTVINGTSQSTVNYASAIQYAAHGAVQQMTLGNALMETTTFNSRLQPTQMVAGNLLTLSYFYCDNFATDCASNNGNMLGQKIQPQPATTYSQSFTYDALNRLKTAAESSGWTQTYVYDQFGNRAVMGGTAPTYIPGGLQTPQVSADDPAQLAGHFPNNRSDVCTQYDAAGNVQTCPWASYSYDAENRLLSAGGTSFVYDGDGRRVQKTSGGATTTYVYDAAGQLAAEYSTAPPANVGTTEYLTADHLGSTRLVSGSILTRHDYLPFGEEIDGSVNGRSSIAGYGAGEGVTQKFTGKERDAETGLDYFGARYLSSAQGRWMSPDWSVDPQPIPFADLTNPQSLNLYGYTGNNPLRYADADGHCCSWSASSVADWVDSKVSTAISFFNQAAVSTGNRGVAATATLVAGATGDVIGGAADTLRLGNGTAAAAQELSQGNYLAAASDLSQDGGRVATVILTATAVGGKLNAPTGDRLQPGPYADDSVPASGPKINASEQQAVNQIGQDAGCHSCGTMNPGTKSGNFIGDHQPANSLANGRSQSLYPHCQHCSSVQGGQASAAVRAGRQLPPQQPPPTGVPQKRPGEN